MSISGASNIGVGQSTDFTANNDADGTIDSYSWSANGGTFSVDDSRIATWTAPTTPQTITISLTAQFGGNNSASATHTIQVGSTPNTSPTITSVTSSDYDITAGDSITLTVVATDDGGTGNLSYSWSAQSGGESNGTFGSSSSASTSWTVGSPGATRFTITVTDSGGLTDSDNSTVVSVRAQNSAPGVTINTSNTTVDGGATITLFSTVSGRPTPSLAWTGSGTFDDPDDDDTDWTAPSPSSQTRYTLRLTATNSLGSDYDEVQITVRGDTATSTPSINSISASDRTIQSGDTITVSISFSGGVSSFSYNRSSS